MACDARRQRQRPDPAAGIGLSRQTQLPRRRVRPERRGPVRNRPAAVRERPVPGAGAPGRGRAQLAKAERDLARDRPLAEQRAIAQSQLDNDISAHDAAQAAVESAKAAVETAQLNVGFTHVTSLIDGVAAIATAQIGDLVGPQTLLTTVSQLDPIKAYFPLSEQEYLGIADQLRGPGGPSQLWQAQGGLSLVLADGSTHPQQGTVLAVDREVDPKMGTIRVSALFPNPGNVLRPGQGGAHPGADGGPDRRAARAAARRVGTAERLPAEGRWARATRSRCATSRSARVSARRWVVESGLKAGEQVVVDGPAVKDGTVVSPHPYVRRPRERSRPVSRFFIGRPIVAIVIAIVTVLGGLVALPALPISQFPQIVPPQISVIANYPGADSLTIEQSVATPLEQQINGVDDMLYMQSINANDGTMTLTVTFDVDTDAEHRPGQRAEPHGAGAAQPAARGQPVRPDHAQADRLADDDHLALRRRSASYDALFLANYANINILDALYRVPGVGEARIFGAGDYAMRIWVKPDALARLALTVPDVANAIRQQSTVNPAGQVGADAGAGRPGDDLHRPRAGAAADGARSSARSPSARIPTVPSSGCATSPASSSARSTTSRSAASNGQPGCAIAVFQAPGLERARRRRRASRR